MPLLVTVKLPPTSKVERYLVERIDRSCQRTNSVVGATCISEKVDGHIENIGKRGTVEVRLEHISCRALVVTTPAPESRDIALGNILGPKMGSTRLSLLDSRYVVRQVAIMLLFTPASFGS